MKRKRLISMALTTAMMASFITVKSKTVQAVENLVAPSVKADIYPKPQEIKYTSNEGMKFDGTVNIVIHGKQKDATLVKVEELLKSQGIDYEESDKVDASKATILITSDKGHCDECDHGFDENIALNEEQGYVLETSNDTNTKGQVTIVGADEDGAYYGVMTLTQMMEQKVANGNFAEATVSDYPSIKLRGYVEGFYGYPWSYEDRLSIIKDSSKYKMNTYIYAPKDDPYHKDQWRTLYPADKAEDIRKLVEEANKGNVSFVWSAHPGYGFNYNNGTDYDLLIAKFEQLYSLGVRQFGISYDDLAGTPNGTQHANIINRVNQEFVKVKGDVKPLIVVGTRYCNGWGPSMTTYFKPLWGNLDEDVVVMWTGANTMSAITKDAYEWPKAQTGVNNKNLAAWWNYPVNDYCDGNLMMSPLENLDNDVDNLTGFFLNPMNQAEASKVALFSGADYSWNVANFERTSSWQRAINELVPEASEAFQRFADNISFIKDGFEFDESRYLVDKIETFSDAIKNGSGIVEAATSLKAEFETMRADVAKLKAINNKSLVKEINTHVDAYDVLAEAGIVCMDAWISATTGDIDGTLTNLDTLSAKLAEVETFTVDSLEGNNVQHNVVKVGQKRIKPLLNDSIVQVKSLLMNVLSPVVDLEVFSSDESLNGKSVTLEGGNYVATDLQVKLGVNGYVGFNLPKASKISEISVEMAEDSNLDTEYLDIQYSLDGINWTIAESKVVKDGVLKTNTPVAAAYVRVVNKDTSEINTNIAKIKVALVYSLGKITAATDLSTYGNNSISNAVDGKMNTKFYSSAGAAVGSYVRVDLGKSIPLFDLKICYAPNPKGLEAGVDGFARTKVEVSTDALTWTQVGDLVHYLDYVIESIDGQTVASVSYNAEGEMARYIRFSTTEAYDNWVQVYEVLYNKTVNNIGDDTVSLADANFDVKNINNLCDGDLTTALTADSINDGNYLTYKLTNITNVSDLMFVQDKENICDAKVSVKDVEGNWKEVGSLSEQINNITINGVITEVKLSFDSSKPLPKIYEMIAKQRTPSEVDRRALTIAVEVAEKITEEELSKVVPAVAQEFKAALAEAKEILADPYTSQEIINNSFDRMSSAIHKLSFIKGDKAALQELVNKIEALNKEDYLVASWDILEPVYQEAKVILANENAMEKEVSEMYTELVNAFLELRLKPNKNILEELINKAEGLNKDEYTDATWKDLENKLNNAKAVFANEEATQEEVTASENSLKNAIENLKEKDSAGEDVNKDSLGELINQAEGLDKDKFTDATWEALENALKNAKAVFANEEANQIEIDEAVERLKLAIDSLELIQDNDSDNKNTGNNGNGDSSENNGTDNESGKGDSTSELPITGGVSPVVIGGIAFIITAIGIVLRRKTH